MMKIRMLLLTSFLSLYLSGCIPLVFGGIAGGMVIYDRRDAKVILQDKGITHQITGKIVKDKSFKQSRVVVSSFNHIVLLAGQVTSPDLRIKAVQFAEQIPDVKQVYNEISVGEPISLGARSSDSVITTKIKSRMLVAENLRSGQIKVITEDSVVYLMGITTKEQADIATDIARSTDGVRKVVRLFEYATE